MKPTLDERMSRPFWSIEDIKVCLKMPYKVAKKVFQESERIEKESLFNSFRPYDTRVRKETVLQLLKIKKADIA